MFSALKLLLNKYVIIGIICILAISSFGYLCYNIGIQSKQAEYDLIADALRDEQIKKARVETEIVVETVVVYKDKIIEIEKKVPVYVNKIREVFRYNDNIVIPADLARVHDAAVFTADFDAYSTEGPDGAPARDVTLAEFSERVVENYGVCHANAEQLRSLQSWTSEMVALYPRL